MLKALYEGSPQAQTDVYRSLASRIYPTALRITGNAEDAEDAMQEAFLRLFRTCMEKNGSIKDNDGSLTAWLKHTAVNCSIDILRRRSLFNTGEPQEHELTTDNEETGNDEDTWADIETVHKATLSLPPAYRTILSLHLFEGYDHEECAEILGVPQGTVRVQYLRAKRRLLKELSKNGQQH